MTNPSIPVPKFPASFFQAKLEEMKTLARLRQERVYVLVCLHLNDWKVEVKEPPKPGDCVSVAVFVHPNSNCEQLAEAVRDRLYQAHEVYLARLDDPTVSEASLACSVHRRGRIPKVCVERLPSIKLIEEAVADLRQDENRILNEIFDGKVPPIMVSEIEAPNPTAPFTMRLAAQRRIALTNIAVIKEALKKPLPLTAVFKADAVTHSYLGLYISSEWQKIISVPYERKRAYDSNYRTAETFLMHGQATSLVAAQLRREMCKTLQEFLAENPRPKEIPERRHGRRRSPKGAGQ
jgi:hypothetical protein